MNAELVGDHMTTEIRLPPADFVPDYMYGIVYRISRPEGGNPDGS